MGNDNSLQKPVKKIIRKVGEKTNLEIKWLGHAGFRLAFDDGEQERVIYIDAWLENPKIPGEFKDKVIDDADLCLVTHGHFDHATSAPDIVKASKKEDCAVAAGFEVTLFYQKYHGLNED